MVYLWRCRVLQIYIVSREVTFEVLKVQFTVSEPY